MLSDKEMYERMAKGWRGGIPDGTVCGQGSTKNNTRIITAWLPELCKRRGIDSICDAGAGDLHWIKDVRWQVDYQAFDLIPRHPDVKKLDITREALPECDAILCRMVLNHLDKARVQDALDLFAESADFLIATHFVNGGIKRERQFTRLDITDWLGEPLEMCRDGHEDNCQLAVWKL